MRFYSLLFFWASAIHIPLITARYKTGTIEGFELDWILAVITIIIQFAYLILFHSKKEIKDLIIPKPVKYLIGLQRIIQKRINLWVYYPLF